MTNSSKKIIVFGATGGTGQAIVNEAIKRSYSVTVFVRDLTKARLLFPAADSRLNFVAGDALNAAEVAKEFSPHTDAVISALGIFQAKAGHDDLTRATDNILQAMKTANTSRFVCVSSLGVGESRGQGNLIVKFIQKLSLRHTLADKEQQETLIRSSGLAWTLIRPSRLMNGNGPDNYVDWVGPAPDKKLIWSINRSDVAHLVLDCLENDTSIEQAINVTGCH